MAGETMLPMPMSPRQSPAEIGSAAVQWACTRRGRTLVMTVLLFVLFIVGMTGMRHHEVGYNFQIQRQREQQMSSAASGTGTA